MEQAEAKRVIDIAKIVKKFVQASEAIAEKGIESRILAMTIRQGEQTTTISDSGNQVYEVARIDGQQSRRTKVWIQSAVEYQIGLEPEDTVTVGIVRDNVYKIHGSLYNSDGVQLSKLKDVVDN